jgi:hypothetical protein
MVGRYGESWQALLDFFSDQPLLLDFLKQRKVELDSCRYDVNCFEGKQLLHWTWGNTARLCFWWNPIFCCHVGVEYVCLWLAFCVRELAVSSNGKKPIRIERVTALGGQKPTK